VFRLGAFFHPDELGTAVCQVYARKKKVPFDSVHWRNKLLTEPPTTASEDGIFVENLYLEGAKWDANAQTLVECGQKELITQLLAVKTFH
jgi:dynein heavy chain